MENKLYKLWHGKWCWEHKKNNYTTTFWLDEWKIIIKKIKNKKLKIYLKNGNIHSNKVNNIVLDSPKCSLNCDFVIKEY